MKTIKLREIVKAVTEDIHTGIPTMIKYEGKRYYRSDAMINYCSCEDGKLLNIDVLDLHYDLDVEVIDSEEELNKKKKELEELKGKVEELENEIDELEEYC